MVVAHPRARSRCPCLAASMVPPHPAGQSALYILSKKRNTPLGGGARGKKRGGRVARTSPPNLPVPQVLCFHDHDEDAPRWVASRSPRRAPHECHPQRPQAGRAWGLSGRGTSTAGVPRVPPFSMANRCVHVDGTPPPPHQAANPPRCASIRICMCAGVWVGGGQGWEPLPFSAWRLYPAGGARCPTAGDTVRTTGMAVKLRRTQSTAPARPCEAPGCTANRWEGNTPAVLHPPSLPPAAVLHTHRTVRVCSTCR